MSANNWTYCPVCTGEAKAKIEAAEVNLTKIYGKVSAEDYMAAVQEARELRKSGVADAETLREDYEIGIVDGEFHVSYRASCGICNFSFMFKHIVADVTLPTS